MTSKDDLFKLTVVNESNLHLQLTRARLFADADAELEKGATCSSSSLLRECIRNRSADDAAV